MTSVAPSSRALSPSSVVEISEEDAAKKIAELVQQKGHLLLYYNPENSSHEFHEFLGRGTCYRFLKRSFQTKLVEGAKFEAANAYSGASAHMKTTFYVGRFVQLKFPIT